MLLYMTEWSSFFVIFCYSTLYFNQKCILEHRMGTLLLFKFLLSATVLSKDTSTVALLLLNPHFFIHFISLL